MKYMNNTTATTNAESHAFIAFRFWMTGDLDWNRLTEELATTGLSQERLAEISRAAQELR
jgi:hypothetical protein